MSLFDFETHVSFSGQRKRYVSHSILDTRAVYKRGDELLLLSLVCWCGLRTI